jgi:hypothetical protein
MSNDLAELTGTIALYIAHERGWPLEDAVAWAHGRMEEAQAEYRAAGAPLGDTETDFIAWLQPLHQSPSA